MAASGFDGGRGMPGGSALVQRLAERRLVRNPQDLSQLTQRQILAWADAHERSTGTWPIRNSGPFPQAPGETWSGVDTPCAARPGWM
jgi:hypothetical protein